MADRRCHNCGELVPSNSITCPKCFRKIPMEPEPVKEAQGKRRESGYSIKLALALAIVPALFGILGLGQIYRNYRDLKGYIFLSAGLLFFVPAVFLVLPIISVFLAIPLFVVYAVIFLVSIADLVLSSVLFHR